MKILIIDNYDSFTFNLYQYVGEVMLGRDFEVIVKRNDKISIDQIKNEGFNRIIISPGPGNPSNVAYFGVCKDVILEIGKETSVLGVCLGFQGIAHYFGGEIIKSPVPMHGKISEIEHDGKGVFCDIPQNIKVMRYHSLTVNPEKIPDCLEITSRVVSENNNGEIMGLRHKIYPIESVQFHPESFATEAGKEILSNFLT